MHWTSVKDVSAEATQASTSRWRPFTYLLMHYYQCINTSSVSWPWLLLAACVSCHFTSTQSTWIMFPWPVKWLWVDQWLSAAC